MLDLTCFQQEDSSACVDMLHPIVDIESQFVYDCMVRSHNIPGAHLDLACNKMVCKRNHFIIKF